MQKNLIYSNYSRTISAVLLTLSLTACASTHYSNPASTAKLLKASGFKMGIADTPEKLSQLKKLPQRKIVPHEQDGNITYIYADVENCECAYAGSEEAYKKYQKLSHKKQRTENDRRNAARNQDSQMDSEDYSSGRNW